MDYNNPQYILYVYIYCIIIYILGSIIPELIINPARGLVATAHMSVTAKAEITCDQEGSLESRGDQLGTSQKGTLSAFKSCGLPWF